MAQYRVTAKVIERRYIVVEAPSKGAAQDWVDHYAELKDFKYTNGGPVLKATKIRQYGHDSDIELDEFGTPKPVSC